MVFEREKLTKGKNSKLCIKKLAQVVKSLSNYSHSASSQKSFVWQFGNGERMLTEINDNKKVYKILNHNIASKLSGDIGTNPGPFVVDPSKTLHSPYSQANSFVFGLNAGKQSKKKIKK